MPPYLQNYQHDIFVSYAHVDDQPLLENEGGWVTTLIGNIEKKLSQRLGRSDAYSLWIDHELARHVNLTPQIIEALSHTAIMIVILSPGYLASEWCIREKNAFLQLIKQGSSRIFVIEREKIEPQQRPDEFRDLTGFPFWVSDRPGKPPKILGEPVPTKDDREYFTLVTDLVYELEDALCSLRKEHEQTPDAAIKELKPTVFLAQVTDD